MKVLKNRIYGGEKQLCRFRMARVVYVFVHPRSPQEGGWVGTICTFECEFLPPAFHSPPNFQRVWPLPFWPTPPVFERRDLELSQLARKKKIACEAVLFLFLLCTRAHVV